MLKEGYDNFVDSIINPLKLFKRKLDVRDSIYYVLILNIIIFVLMSIYQYIFTGFTFGKAIITIFLFALGLVVLILMIYVSSLVFYLVTKNLFKVKSKLNDMFNLFAYCLTPLRLANLFTPFSLYVIPVFIIWNLVLLMYGISAKFKVSKIKALIISVVSYLIIFVVIGIIANLFI